jgi:hypothetical protein
MLIAAVVMWALSRWLPLAFWIRGPWNRVGTLPAAIGFAIAVAAFVQFRHVRTTVNPMDPSKATRLVTDGIFHLSRKSDVPGTAAVADRMGGLAPEYKPLAHSTIVCDRYHARSNHPRGTSSRAIVRHAIRRVPQERGSMDREIDERPLKCRSVGCEMGGEAARGPIAVSRSPTKTATKRSFN